MFAEVISISHFFFRLFLLLHGLSCYISFSFFNRSFKRLDTFCNHLSPNKHHLTQLWPKIELNLNAIILALSTHGACTSSNCIVFGDIIWICFSDAQMFIGMLSIWLVDDTYNVKGAIHCSCCSMYTHHGPCHGKQAFENSGWSIWHAIKVFNHFPHRLIYKIVEYKLNGLHTHTHAARSH